MGAPSGGRYRMPPASAQDIARAQSQLASAAEQNRRWVQANPIHRRPADYPTPVPCSYCGTHGLNSTCGQCGAPLNHGERK